MQDKQTDRTWRKASMSDANGGCVEVSFDVADEIAVRDSKLDGNSPILTFTPHEWACFLDGASKGEFNLPS